MVLKSKMFRSLLNNTTDKTAIPPPINAEKKFVKKCKQMLEMKCPKILEGAMIREYLKDVEIKLIFKFGTTFLIFL